MKKIDTKKKVKNSKMVDFRYKARCSKFFYYKYYTQINGPTTSMDTQLEEAYRSP